MEARWRNLSEFPRSNEDWAAYFLLFFVKVTGQNRAEKYLNYVNILTPVLVRSPSSDERFLPPYLIDTENISRKLKRNTRIMMWMTLIYAVAGGVLFSVIADTWLASKWFVISIMMTGFMYSGLKGFDHPGFYEERSRFYGWSILHGASVGWLYIGFLLVLGAIQYSLVARTGIEQTLESYGTLFEAVAEGECWRFLTGPYLHTGVAHWMSNLLMGSGLILGYFPALGWRIVPIFLICASFSFLGTYSSWLFDAGTLGIVGVSGGISGVAGTFLAANLRFPELFPPKMATTTFWVALMTFLTYSLVTDPFSFSAHLAGFLLGIGIGYMINPIDKGFVKDSG